jgi:hypothetical protein
MKNYLLKLSWVRGEKIIAVLAMSFALTLFSFGLLSQPVLSEDIFNDIDSHWSRHVVNWLAGDNPDNISYLQKEGENFRPGCPITRGEWVAMSMQVLDLENRPDAGQNRVANAPRCADVPSWPCPFSDISATARANPPQLRSLYFPTFQAFRTGMMSGYDDGTFRPDKGMTYAEAVSAFAGLLNLVPKISELQKQVGEDPSIIGTDYFINGIVMEDEWFSAPLHGALLANLVALNWPLEFYPYRPPISRGETAMMMYLSLVYEGKTTLDNSLLGREVFPGENALRHIRQGGQADFSFGPPYFERECND